MAIKTIHNPKRKILNWIELWSMMPQSLSFHKTTTIDKVQLNKMFNSMNRNFFCNNIFQIELKKAIPKHVSRQADYMHNWIQTVIWRRLNAIFYWSVKTYVKQHSNIYHGECSLLWYIFFFNLKEKVTAIFLVSIQTHNPPPPLI